MLLGNKIKQDKQKTKNKHSLKDCMEQFFNFSYKNIVHDNIMLFDVALFVQKNTMRMVYAERIIK